MYVCMYVCIYVCMYVCMYEIKLFVQNWGFRTYITFCMDLKITTLIKKFNLVYFLPNVCWGGKIRQILLGWVVKLPHSMRLPVRRGRRYLMIKDGFFLADQSATQQSKKSGNNGAYCAWWAIENVEFDQSASYVKRYHLYNCTGHIFQIAPVAKCTQNVSNFKDAKRHFLTGKCSKMWMLKLFRQCVNK